MKEREITFLVVALILATIFGGLIGEIVGSFLPEGAAKTLFQKSIEVGFDPQTVKLYAVAFTIGLLIKINFVSVLMVVGVIAYFRWWYL